jgi:hypothetical protein
MSARQSIPSINFILKLYLLIRPGLKIIYFDNYMESLTQIFDKYESDKNSRYHNYCRQYDDILKKYRSSNIGFLELGVFKGESLKIWREVFPNASHIVGVDIDPECKQYEDIDNNIFVEIGDATDISFLNYLIRKYNYFNLIIDDASHTNRDVILSFEKLFPIVEDNGLYIVEDTITYKSQAHINTNYPNHIQYFCKFIPYLNQWRHDSTDGIKDHCVDPFKIIKKAENIFEASIDNINFGVSFIGISKKIRNHWL